MDGRGTLLFPEALPDLVEGIVHVWRADLDDPRWARHDLVAALTHGERQGAGASGAGSTGRRRTAARALNRALLGACLNCDPAEIALSYGPHGKPRLANARAAHDLRFNLSHAGSRVLFAVALQRDVGIDIERVRERPRLDRLAERWFSEREAAILRNLPPAERQRAFYACWTRKEAFVKARGDGLALPLREFDVTVEAGSPPRLLHTAWDPDEARRWSLHDIPAGDGYLAALAVREPDSPGNGDQRTETGPRVTVELHDLPSSPGFSRTPAGRGR